MRVLELNHGLTDASARFQKLDEAARILQHGPTRDRDADIGVAIGFVQSGKTMSFTTLAALAADDGYRVIVLILGNTHLLVDQNVERLKDDLQIRQRDDWVWAHTHMPSASFGLDDLLRQDRRVVLITLLKHAKRIDAVAGMFERSTLVQQVPVLIVDDEADQASLNAGVRRNRVTPTYRSIRRLRSALPQHLYVQYTATPFAPLLLEPQDGLAPQFAELLTPGDAYTGGRAFFLDHRSLVIRRVAESEADEKAPDALPSGLREALDSFIVGTALQRADDLARVGVSMLVHTSGLKTDHQHLQRLIRGHVEAARTRAELPSTDAGKRAWLRAIAKFRADFEQHGAPKLADEDYEGHLRWVLQMTRIWIVNSSAEGENPDWSLSPVNILIGGNKLDRGFTVRGLTTSYITRRAAGGQADTIEQRARCYGYKRPYLKYCRIFAPDNVIDAFTALVHTEADLRDSIASWQDAGLDLRDWSAENGILLPDDVRPTRPSVLRDPYDRHFTGWSFLRRPASSAQEVSANLELVKSTGLLEQAESRFGEVCLRTLETTPDVLLHVLQNWIGVDSPGWDQTVLWRGVSSLVSAGVLRTCRLIFLELAGGAPRIRRWREPDGFDQLMQGRNDGTGYPGDRGLFDGLQLQIHRVQARDSSDETLALALFVPELRGSVAKATRRLADPAPVITSGR